MSVLSLMLLVAGIGTAPADTTVVLGTRSVDLTGDGEQEVLRLVGNGASLDSLEVTFSVESSGRVLYRQTLHPVTRTAGFDAGKRTLSVREHRQRLRDIESFFFAAEKFSSPATFVEKLRRIAPRHLDAIPAVIARDSGSAVDEPRAAAIWKEILQGPAVVFEFSSGGDAVTAIAWSEAEQRFFRLWECC